MAKVSFFTAISFETRPKSYTQSALETIDSYFYLGGKKAYAVSGDTQQESQGTMLREGSSSFLMTALKVISYLTIVIPVVLLIAKAILRSIHTFHIIEPVRSDKSVILNKVRAVKISDADPCKHECTITLTDGREKTVRWDDRTINCLTRKLSLDLISTHYPLSHFGSREEASQSIEETLTKLFK